MRDLIGQEVEILNEESKIYKKITIANVKESKNGLIITDKDGNIYTDEEVNWHYVVTPEFLLYQAVRDSEIADLKEFPLEWDSDKWKLAFKTFMESLIKSGYIKERDESN